MHPIETEIRRELLALAAPDYKKFQCALMPTVDPDTVIGVRMPALRRLAKQYTGAEKREAFFKCLPHRYYEENNLHGILISDVKEYAEVVHALDAFLPHVDNWATCDLIRPAVFHTHPPALPEQIMRWMQSPHPYTVRFAMEMLMVYYLDGHFDAAWPRIVAEYRSEEYYIRMMQAWYFSAALAVRWGEILPFLTEKRLSPWVHAMTIRKACESFRIPEEHKNILRTLR